MEINFLTLPDLWRESLSFYQICYQGQVRWIINWILLVVVTQHMVPVKLKVIYLTTWLWKYFGTWENISTCEKKWFTWLKYLKKNRKPWRRSTNWLNCLSSSHSLLFSWAALLERSCSLGWPNFSVIRSYPWLKSFSWRFLFTWSGDIFLLLWRTTTMNIVTSSVTALLEIVGKISNSKCLKIEARNKVE